MELLPNEAVTTCQGQFPLTCVPPFTPAFSRMVEEKIRGLNITESAVKDAKEMSRHLHIVDWLWNSGEVHLGGFAGVSTPSSRNLVVVRSGPHWFDQPRNPNAYGGLEDKASLREENYSPISMISELLSDFEDELIALTE